MAKGADCKSAASWLRRFESFLPHHASPLRATRGAATSRSLRANGSRERAPDDRLREAIHVSTVRKVDCFVAALPCANALRLSQAMTSADTRPRSRGTTRPGSANSLPPKQRAWGMPGARCTRSRACSVVNTRVSHHGYTGSPGIPARDGFNGLLRALPGDRACLSPSPTQSPAST